MLDEVIDFRDQVFDVPETTSSDGLPRDETKPPFDLIEPGRVGWRGVHLEALSLCHPESYLGMLMSVVVVDNEVDIETRGHGLIDTLEEFKKLLMTMACLALRDDSSGGDVE